jgi:hypothetical protein
LITRADLLFAARENASRVEALSARRDPGLIRIVL